MGAASSVQNLPEKVDKSTIQQFAGDKFDEEKFADLNSKSLVEEDGVVSRDDLIAYTINIVGNDGVEKIRPSRPGLERAGTKTAINTSLEFDTGDLGLVPKSARMRSKELRAFQRVVQGSPSLAKKHAHVAIEMDLLTAAEKAAQREARRKAMREQAAAALARFEQMSAEERESARNDGDLDMYSNENLDKREAIREASSVVTVLEEWWSAAKLFDDADGSETLDLPEYTGFHRRLLRLLEFNASDAKLSEEEAQAVMQEDFKVDAGADGLVVKQEFLYVPGLQSQGCQCELRMRRAV